MNAMRWLAAAAVVCLVSAGARADNKADYAKLLVGKWEVTKSERLPVGSVLEFTKDGKVKMTRTEDGKEESREATYKLDGDQITVTEDGKNKSEKPATIKKLTETELTVMADDMTIEFKRKK